MSDMSTMVSVRFTAEQLEILDRLCASSGRNVSEVMRDLVERAGNSSLLADLPACGVDRKEILDAIDDGRTR